MINNNAGFDDQRKEFLKRGLEILRKYRNQIAHGNKVFATSVKQLLNKKQLVMFSNERLSKKDLEFVHEKSDLLNGIIVLGALLDKETSKMLFEEIEIFLQQNASFILSTGQNIFDWLRIPQSLDNTIKKR